MDYNNQNNQFGQNNQGQYGQQPMNQYGMAQNQPVQPQMGYQQPMAGGMNGYQYNNPSITKNEYYKSYADKKVKNNIVSAAVFLYICFGINFLGSFIAAGNSSVILDCIIILALGLCIQILKSRIAAVISLCYGVINVAMYLILFGQLGGILLPIAGICACMGTFKLETEYKAYIGR